MQLYAPRRGNAEIAPRNLEQSNDQGALATSAANVQLKRALAGQGFEAQAAMLAPTPAAAPVQMKATGDGCATGLDQEGEDASDEVASKHPDEAKGEVQDEAKADEASDVDQAKALFDKAAAAYGAGQFMVAADLFADADTLSHHPELSFSRAQALRHAGGHREEAIALYEAYLAEAPAGSRAADATSLIAELTGPAKSGDEEIDTPSAKQLFDKAAAAYQKGEFMVAADQFAMADKLVHKPELAFSRAQALRKAGGHREEAIALFQSYVDEAPGGARAKDAEAFIAELNGPSKSGDEAIDTPEAKQLFEKAAQAYDKGQFMVASDLFAQAETLYHSPKLLFSRAQALRKAGGHREEAAALYQSYLAEEPSGDRAADATQFLKELAPPKKHGD